MSTSTTEKHKIKNIMYRVDTRLNTHCLGKIKEETPEYIVLQDTGFYVPWHQYGKNPTTTARKLLNFKHLKSVPLESDITMFFKVQSEYNDLQYQFESKEHHVGLLIGDKTRKGSILLYKKGGIKPEEIWNMVKTNKRLHRISYYKCRTNIKKLINYLRSETATQGTNIHIKNKIECGYKTNELKYFKSALSSATAQRNVSQQCKHHKQLRKNKYQN